MSIKLEEYGLSLRGRQALCRMDGLADMHSRPPYMVVLDDVAIVGPLVAHMHSDKKLYSINLEKGEVSGDFGTSTNGYAKAQLEKECGPKKSGAYMMLWNMRAQNIWHWIMETLPKVIMADAYGFDGFFIVPPILENTAFIDESLELLGIARHRILTYDGQPWRVEKLYIPQSINGHRMIGDYPELLSRLRQRLMNGANTVSPVINRIYIARDEAKFSRGVTNETALLEVLFRFDFQRVVMERFSLSEQIRIAANAECIIGPHGAGMVHSLSMPPGSLVIELFSPGYVNPCILPIVDYLKHQYFMIPTAGINLKPTQDLTANTQAIELTLARELM